MEADRTAVEVAEALLKACLNRALEAFGNGLEGTALNEELVSVLAMVHPFNNRLTLVLNLVHWMCPSLGIANKVDTEFLTKAIVALEPYGNMANPPNDAWGLCQSCKACRRSELYLIAIASTL